MYRVRKNAIIVDNAAYEAASNVACQLVGSAAYAAVPVTTEGDIASVAVYTSDLLAAGMDGGAGRRPFDQVSDNVVQSTAFSTANTANILQYNSDMNDIAVDRYELSSTVIDNRDMRHTAMNVPVIRSTAAANAAMAEIGRFSRSNNNNECMQFDDDVCMTSDTVSTRVHEVRRDTLI